MEIIDLTDSLPWNTNGSRWPQRNPKKIKQIVVHQSLGTKTVYDTNAYCITNSPDMSMGRGMPKIPYHFFIHQDGHIFQCNKIAELTTHVKNMNTISVGVCLGGFFNYGTTVARDGDPSQEQMESLDWLLKYLIEFLKLNKRAVYTHDELQGKPSCPGNKAAAYIQNFKKERT